MFRFKSGFAILLSSVFMFTNIVSVVPAYAEGAVPEPPTTTVTGPVAHYFTSSATQVSQCKAQLNILSTDDCNKDTNSVLAATGASNAVAGSAISSGAGVNAINSTAESTGAINVSSMEFAKQKCDQSLMKCSDVCDKANVAVIKDGTSCIAAENAKGPVNLSADCRVVQAKLQESTSSTKLKCNVAKVAFAALAVAALAGLASYMMKAKKNKDTTAANSNDPYAKFPEKYCQANDLKCLCTSNKGGSDQRCSCFDAYGSSSYASNSCMCSKFGDQADVSKAYGCSTNTASGASVGPINTINAGIKNTNSTNSLSGIQSKNTGDLKGITASSGSGSSGSYGAASGSAGSGQAMGGNSASNNSSTKGSKESGEIGSGSKVGNADFSEEGGGGSGKSSVVVSGGDYAGAHSSSPYSKYLPSGELRNVSSTDEPDQIGQAHGMSPFEVVKVAYRRHFSDLQH
jgi:hypothetical protein